MKDRDKKGRQANHKGERHPGAKITDRIAKRIFSAKGYGRHIAKKFNVHVTTVSDIKRKRSWTHIH